MRCICERRIAPAAGALISLRPFSWDSFAARRRSKLHAGVLHKLFVNSGAGRTSQQQVYYTNWLIPLLAHWLIDGDAKRARPAPLINSFVYTLVIEIPDALVAKPKKARVNRQGAFNIYWICSIARILKEAKKENNWVWRPC